MFRVLAERAATTVASSLVLRKSRNKTPAITLGWLRNSPGYFSNDQFALSPSECIISSEPGGTDNRTGAPGPSGVPAFR